MDSLLRMYILPQVHLDPTELAEHLDAVRAEAAAAMAQVSHIDKSVFSSQQKFKLLLEQHGVDVPKKISPTTG